VELRGGSVDAASDGPGRGGEFVVCLPLAAPLPERPDMPAVTRPVSVPARPRRILVVVVARTYLVIRAHSAARNFMTSVDGPSDIEAE
jgi:hypothetical protein